MWIRVKTLVIKELFFILFTPIQVFLLILPAITQLFVYSYAATFEVKNVSIGVLNLDQGEKSLELLERFKGSRVFAQIFFLSSSQEIGAFIDNRRGIMVISIEDRFSSNLESNKQGHVQLILDGRRSNASQIVAGYANAIIERFAEDQLAHIPIRLQSTELAQRIWFNPNLIYPWYNAIALVPILGMLTGLILTAFSVAREREMGTFDQLLVSPLSPFEIACGKSIAALILTLAQSLLCMILIIWVLQVPFTGSFFWFYFSLTIFIFSSLGMGLFISSLCHTQQQAIFGAFFFVGPSVLLSGYVTPIENMPLWFQNVTYLIPLRYMLVITKGSFLKGMSATIVLENTWQIALIALTSLGLASWQFKRRLD